MMLNNTRNIEYLLKKSNIFNAIEIEFDDKTKKAVKLNRINS